MAENRYDPASYTDALAGADGGIAVTVGGKVWRLGFPTQNAKARFEQYLVDYELKLVKRQKAFLSPDEYTARMDAFAEQVENRAFSTGGVLWLKHSLKPVGWMLWVRALFAENHKDITPDQVAEVVKAAPEEMRVALLMVIPPFVKWVVRLTGEVVRQAGDPEKVEKWAAEEAKLMASFHEGFPDQPTPST
jgi:hypothetical protein